MAYLARNVALYFTAFRTEAAISLAGTFLGLQLLGIAISALAAVLLLADYLVAKNAAAPNVANSEPTPTIPEHAPPKAPRKTRGSRP
jgi:hypothetical protein